MEIYLTVIAALALWAVASTVRHLTDDGLGRVPDDPSRRR